MLTFPPNEATNYGKHGTTDDSTYHTRITICTYLLKVLWSLNNPSFSNVGAHTIPGIIARS